MVQFTYQNILILNISLNISTAKVAPLYIVPQNMTTPNMHIIVAMRVAYGILVKHLSQHPKNIKNNKNMLINKQSVCKIKTFFYII